MSEPVEEPVIERPETNTEEDRRLWDEAEHAEPSERELHRPLGAEDSNESHEGEV